MWQTLYQRAVDRVMYAATRLLAADPPYPAKVPPAGNPAAAADFAAIRFHDNPYQRRLADNWHPGNVWHYQGR
ncbi:hypothetical protein BG74_00285 [Sodalis-like endosymbiont of Proechinophthirus fluctus]|nr:hypothetical protein BG74_00285 [Sodalis-like endosymbiont of Proechinophthirus fluctus]